MDFRRNHIVGNGERARLGRCESRPRGSLLRSKLAQRLDSSHAAGVRREARRTAPEAGALPKTLIRTPRQPVKRNMNLKMRSLCPALTLTCMLFACGLPAQILWYHQSAGSDWNAALPVGNGRLGAMVFG